MAAINSNGVLDFSQPQEQPFVNTQVPPETYKTGTSIGTNPALNITPTMMNKKPVPETKGVYCPYINKLYAHNNKRLYLALEIFHLLYNYFRKNSNVLDK